MTDEDEQKAYQEIMAKREKEKARCFRRLGNLSEILEFLKTNREATVEEVKKALPHIRRPTIRRVLRQIES